MLFLVLILWEDKKDVENQVFNALKKEERRI